MSDSVPPPPIAEELYIRLNKLEGLMEELITQFVNVKSSTTTTTQNQNQNPCSEGIDLEARGNADPDTDECIKGDDAPRSRPKADATATDNPSCNCVYCVPPCDIGFNSVALPSEEPEPEPHQGNFREEIGLQTDMDEEDPDVFYFAGGRTVGLQTDSAPKYPPLTPISFNSHPEIIVLDNCGSNGEEDLTPTEERDAKDDFNRISSLNNDCGSQSNSQNGNIQVLSGRGSGSEKIHSTSTERKSSATQLSASAGVIALVTGKSLSSSSQKITGDVGAGLETKEEVSRIRITATAADSGLRSGTTGHGAGKTKKAPAPTTPICISTSKHSISRPTTRLNTPVTPPKSTFAEKAKHGMVKQNQGPAPGKSVSSNLSRIGNPPSPSPSLHKPTTGTAKGATVGVGVGAGNVTTTGLTVSKTLRGTRPSTTPATTGTGSNKIQIKPRSNNASRRRTAVHTGQPQLSQLAESHSQIKVAKEKIVKSFSSSKTSLTSSAVASASLAVSTISNSKPYRSGSATIEKQALQQRITTSEDCEKRHFKGYEEREIGEGGGDPHLNGNEKEPVPNYSKEIVNPRNRTSADSHAGAGDKVAPVDTSLLILALRQEFTRSKSMINHHYNNNDERSSVSPLSDETTYRRRSHTVDADGWETVKARCRPKWASLNSSFGDSNVNHSRNFIDKEILEVTSDKATASEDNHPATTKSKSNNTSTITSNDNDNGLKANRPLHSQSQVKKSAVGTSAKPEKVSDREKEKTHSQTQGKYSINKPKNVNLKAKMSKKQETTENGNSTTPVSPGSGKDAYESSSCSGDDEQIMRKEADLDDAIREEELLEEELLQVEKDFEIIENDNTGTRDDGDAGDTMDNDNKSDPRELELDDQFFFISMEDDNPTAADDISPKDLGRIISLREKFMSPIKKCDSEETLRRYEAKLAKAERNRENLLQAKFNRYVELSEHFASLNESTKKLVAERDELIAKAEERRKRAEKKRLEYLTSIRRKAHDQTSKAHEIAYDKLLEAEKKRHGYFAAEQEIVDRLRTIQEERRIKLEERAGKASLVIKRQNRIKNDWQSKLNLLKEKRRTVDERIRREKEKRAQERRELAQEKAREREEKISALNAAKQTEKEELKQKIRQKQEGSARRHEEKIKCIRQKAIEMGSPRSQEENNVPGTVRICTLCKVIIQSDIHEMQHVRGKNHMDKVRKAEKSHLEAGGGVSLVEGFGLKFLADVPHDKMDSEIQPDRNRYKAVKKHSKKLMQKLMDSGLAFEALEKERMVNIQRGDPNSLKSKTKKNIMELDRLVSHFENGKGSPSAAIMMDRLIAKIRKAAVQNLPIKNVIIGMNGLEVGMKVLQCVASDLPVKTKIAAVEMIHGFILGSLPNALHILRGTGICRLMNLCAERWSTLIPDVNRCGSPLRGSEVLPADQYLRSVVALLQTLLTILPDPYNGISKKGSFLTQSDVESIKLRTFDIIGYLVASGVIDRISVYCGGVRGPVDNQPGVSGLLEVFIDLLVVLAYTLQFCLGDNANSCTIKKEPDMTKLLASLEASELAGTVSMSYSLLLHHGAPLRSRPRTVDALSSSETPPPPGNLTTEVVKCTLCLINAMSRLDILALQNVLGSETVSLQFRHIASQLLWQVVPHRSVPLMRRLLNELITSIGNFTAGNLHNQATIQSGQTPTVLQLLCTLPKEFFTDVKFKHIFLPTLIAATNGCPENQEILVQNNIDVEMLENYLHSAEGKSNVIIKRMVSVGC